MWVQPLREKLTGKRWIHLITPTHQPFAHSRQINHNAILVNIRKSDENRHHFGLEINFQVGQMQKSKKKKSCK